MSQQHQDQQQQQGRLTLGQQQAQSTFGTSSFVANETMLQQLVQMGFDAPKAESALLATGNRSIDVAIEYMYNNPNCGEEQARTTTTTTTMIPPSVSSPSSSSPSLPLSTSGTPLSASEVKRTADLLVGARRGLKGESLETKIAFEERQRQAEAEKLRKQKMEEKKRLKELRMRMKEEKEGRLRAMDEQRRRFEQNLNANNVVRTNRYEVTDTSKPVPATATPTTVPISSSASSSTASSSGGAVRDCTIQIRLPDGKTLMTTITSDKTLQEVYDFVQSNVEDFSVHGEQFSLMTPFPRKEYNPEEISLNGVSLSQAGLVPRGSLIVQKLKSKGKVTRGDAMTDDNDDNEDEDTTTTTTAPILTAGRTLGGGSSSSSRDTIDEEQMLEDSDVGTAQTYILTMKGPWLRVPEEEREFASVQGTPTGEVMIFRPKLWVEANCESRRRTAINFIGKDVVSEARVDGTSGISTSYSGSYKIRYSPSKKRSELTMSMSSEPSRTMNIVSLTDEILVLSPQ